MIARITPAAVLAFLLAIAYAQAENWPQWRGPQGTGIATDSAAPLEWSAEKNVLWKTPLPGDGNSTPIVWGDKIFLTCAYEKGKQRALICYGREKGEELWRQVIAYDKPEASHESNPACASSPVTDGERVVAWHSSAGLYCYDLAGKELWRKDLGEFQHIWGFASSPVIHENLVILNAGPGLSAFLVAFNKKTGEEVWRKTPPEVVSQKFDEFRGSWSTPVIIKEGDRSQLLVSLPLALRAFDPATGNELWSCRGLSKLLYTSPVVGNGICVAMSGYHGPAMALRLGGKGDVTDTHRLWLHDQKIPQRVGSGVIVGDHFYIINEPGIASCVDLKTGELAWEKRVTSSTWSSLVAAGTRLYGTSMSGESVILEADPTACKVLATNKINEMTRASLVITNGQVLQRTYKHLWCFGSQAAK